MQREKNLVLEFLGSSLMRLQGGVFSKQTQLELSMRGAYQQVVWASPPA